MTSQAVMQLAQWLEKGAEKPKLPAERVKMAVRRWLMRYQRQTRQNWHGFYVEIVATAGDRQLPRGIERLCDSRRG
jgi:ribosomal protein L13E